MNRIVEIKLAEIQKHRKRLLDLFDSITQQAEKESSLERKLEVYLEGLQKKPRALGKEELGKEQVHAIRVLLEQYKHGAVGKEVLEAWLSSLQKEVAHGRVQTDFTYLFGAILQEWTTTTSSSSSSSSSSSPAPSPAEVEVEDDYLMVVSPDARAQFARKVEAMLKPHGEEGKGEGQGRGEGDVDLPYFEGLLKRHGPHLQSAKLFLPENPQALGKVAVAEVKQAAAALCHDNLVSLRVKRSLKALERDDVIANEYAGVMTLMVKNYQEWGWGEGELPLKLLCNRNGKWRVFVEEDIVTALFLQVVGARWALQLRRAMVLAWNQLYPSPEYNYSNFEYQAWSLEQGQLFCALPRSATEVASSAGEYGGGGGSSSSSSSSSSSGEPKLRQQLLQYLATLTKRARERGRPLTVVSTDIKDFYLTFPHDLVLRLLRGLGCPAPWVEFCSRFLRPSVVLREGGREVRGTLSRGLPTGHILSKALHEVLLFFCDLEVRRKGVTYLRNFDDYYLVAERAGEAGEAFSSLDAFVRRAGMRLNPNKSGHVIIPAGEGAQGGGEHESDDDDGGESEEEELEKEKEGEKGEGKGGVERLPQGAVRFGLLTMDGAGHFVADEEAVGKVEQAARLRLSSTPAIIPWVRAYNRFANHLLKNLGNPCLALGSPHAESVIKVMSRLQTLTPSGKRATQYLGDEITRRFFREGEGERRVVLPEGWYYWPITTGGLGLLNPLILLPVLRLQIAALEENQANKFTKALEGQHGRILTAHQGEVSAQPPPQLHGAAGAGGGL